MLVLGGHQSCESLKHCLGSFLVLLIWKCPLPLPWKKGIVSGTCSVNSDSKVFFFIRQVKGLT